MNKVGRSVDGVENEGGKVLVDAVVLRLLAHEATVGVKLGNSLFDEVLNELVGTCNEIARSLCGDIVCKLSVENERTCFLDKLYKVVECN